MNDIMENKNNIDEPRVKYLFNNMRLSRYKAMQLALVLAWCVCGILSFVVLRGSEHWYFRHMWLVCGAGAAGEIIETRIALKKFTCNVTKHDDLNHEPNKPSDATR